MIRTNRWEFAEIIEKYGLAHTPPVYTDSQFLVRELFWKRLETFLAMSCPLERNRVLDFGGGNGVLAPTLSRLYRKVFCVDLRTEVGEELSRREKIKNISFLTGELASFKLPDNHFDTIIATDVLEHIPAHDELLKEFCRLLTPGGELLVCSPSENWFYELGRKMFGYTKPPDHYHTAAFIDKTLSQRFLLAKQRYFPLNIPALGVFSLARFVNNSTHP